MLCCQCGLRTAPHVDGRCRVCCRNFCDGCYGEINAPMCRDCTSASAAEAERDDPAGAPLFHERFCQHCSVAPAESSRDFTLCAICRRWYCGRCFGPKPMVCQWCWNNLRDDMGSQMECAHVDSAHPEVRRCSGCAKPMHWCCRLHSQFMCGSCRRPLGHADA